MDGAERRRLRLAAAILTAIAVGEAVVDDGGYSAGPRVLFGALAVAAAALAVLAAPARARRLARTPVIWVLVVLGGLGAVSAAWTVAVPGDALRWGLVTVGFGATVLAAAILVAERRAAAIAAGALALLAVVAGVVGLVAAARTSTPFALREAGRWRPAAEFQYPPALALLMVGALPGLLSGMLHPRPRIALPAALGGAVSAAVLALTDSRTELGFALIVCAAAVLWPLRTTGASRGRTAAAVALLAACALGAYAVAGGYIVVTPPPDTGARLAGLGALLAGTAVVWAAARAALARRVPPAAVVALLLAAGAAGALAKPAPRLISSGIAPQKVARHHHPAHRHAIRDELLHGRLRIWHEALQTFADRPLQGGGADSYLEASAAHQGPRSVFYAHDLPLELAAELGIGGLLLALALYLAAGRALWRSRARAGRVTWLLGPAALAFLLANLVDWPWHLAGSGAVWAAALGGMLGSGATQGRH